MKKLLVVLTILVLVAGFAFATVTGSVEARYVFNFSDDAPKTLTYGVWGTHSKIAFSLSTDKGGIDGSNKPYAVVAVELSLSTPSVDATTELDTLTYDGASKATYTFLTNAGWNLTVALKLTDFRIVGENWEINFLKAIGVGDYAKSAWELNASKKAIDAPWSFAATEGVTFTYDDYKIGIRATRNNLLVTNVDLRTESKEFTFAEGVTGQAAVALGLVKQGDEDATIAFGASVKAAYATDDVTVNGAVDVQYENEKFDADAAVKVAVKPVTVDAYYATRLQAERAHTLLSGKAENVLSVKAVVALDPVTVTVYGEDLINADRLLAIKEEGKFGALTEDAQFGIYPSIDEEEILGYFFKNLWFANAGIGYDVQENLNVNAHAGYMRMNLVDDAGHLSALVFQAGAEYKLEKFTFAADAYLGKSFTKLGDVDLSDDLRFGCEVSASSDKLVENAVLTATLHIDKYGVIGLYDATLVDAYAGQELDLDDQGMYFQVGCKVAF